MRGRCFHATEGGLETRVTFQGIEISVLCYPDVFALEKDVWLLGQEAMENKREQRFVFDAAFKLLNDRTLGEGRGLAEPTSLAQVLLLLNHATQPNPTGLMGQWREKVAVDAATSAEVFHLLMQEVASDVQQQQEHFRQKNAIAKVLKDQCGIESQPPKTGDPHGWVTFALRKAAEWNGCELEECFHGTSMTLLSVILREGLKKPKNTKDSAHGQRGSQSKQSIYLSPSWHYCAHPVYSPLHVMGPNAFQMVLKCEVLQGQYQKQNGTLGGKHWPHNLRIDPDRDSLEDIEYLVEDEAVVRLKEVMFRQFGRHSDPEKYGDLPPKLVVNTQGQSDQKTKEQKTEYRWTEMLQADFEARGLYLRHHQHA